MNVAIGGQSGLTGSADPATLTFTVAANVYDSTAPQGTGPYNETQQTTVSVTAPSGTASGFSAQLTVTGEFPGGSYGANQSDPTQSGGCGPNEFPGATGEGSIDVNVQPDVTNDDGSGGNGDGGDGGTGGGGGNGTDDGDDGGNGIPVPTWIVPVGVVSAALIATRRKDR